MRHIAFFAVLALMVGCSGRRGDPPPPAASANVPTAPPGAMGALAAGNAPTPSLATPYDPDEPYLEEPPSPPMAPPAPPLTTPAPSDAGVSL